MSSLSTSRWLSPLRYPGGKGVLAHFIGSVLQSNKPRSTTYLEPFAGGAGVGLYLLFHEYVERIVLNDLDPGIAALWRSVFHHSSDLIELISGTEVSVSTWEECRAVYEDAQADDLELGFATLFLNRTNRSGILTARPIGGLRQTGKWKIDARFNRRNLIERIRILSRYSSRVAILEQNALDLLTPTSLSSWPNLFLYADPPYLSKSGDLYLNNLSWKDHVQISRLLRGSDARWVVTYDADDRVAASLYPSSPCAAFTLSHSAATQHFGREYIVFSPSLTIYELDSVGPHGATWLDP